MSGVSKIRVSNLLDEHIDIGKRVADESTTARGDVHSCGLALSDTSGDDSDCSLSPSSPESSRSSSGCPGEDDEDDEESEIVREDLLKHLPKKTFVIPPEDLADVDSSLRIVVQDEDPGSTQIGDQRCAVNGSGIALVSLLRKTLRLCEETLLGQPFYSKHSASRAGPRMVQLRDRVKYASQLLHHSQKLLNRMDPSTMPERNSLPSEPMTGRAPNTVRTVLPPTLAGGLVQYDSVSAPTGNLTLVLPFLLLLLHPLSALLCPVCPVPPQLLVCPTKALRARVFIAFSFLNL
eukprot:NODE_1154_length_1670_cov_21.036397_g1024_i0.p1 GENE.NODE_1154_length_1670_cov_21.036397_g1024_i0~~NODE_1154_length_1670_cov_21.036397_g1024_i0.p1  ORF type:complete len:292 (+),score=28.53 NODE_1154_length_1670_cov_21.036397_g1024_i0:242-1117(+)